MIIDADIEANTFNEVTMALRQVRLWEGGPVSKALCPVACIEGKMTDWRLRD